MKINIDGGYSVLEDNPKKVMRILKEFCLSKLPENNVFQIIFNNEKIQKIGEILDKMEENITKDVPKLLR